MFSDKYFKLSFIFHVILIVILMMVAQYHKPIAKIQISLVPNILQNKKLAKPKNIAQTKLVKQVATKVVKKAPSKLVKKTKTTEKIKDKVTTKEKAVISKLFHQESKIKPLPSPQAEVIKTPSKKSTKNHTVIDMKPQEQVVVPKKAILAFIKKDLLSVLERETKNPIKIKKDLQLPVDMPTDLDDLAMSMEEKKILSSSLSKCVSILPKIREEDEELFLRFSVDKNTIVENIAIIRNNMVIPEADLNSLERKVIAIFTNTECSKLLLPQGKYQIWHEFTVKLKLQSFFNE